MVKGRIERVRSIYRAFAAGDRALIESAFADDFRFSSPPDPDLDRAGYFERCWPGAGRGQQFDFIREIESGDEVVVTYEMECEGVPRGRNTEVLTFSGERISRVEVYFGWSVASGS